MTPAAIATTQVNAANNANNATAVTAPTQQALIDPRTGNAFKLVGLEETLEQLRQCTPKLADVINAENIFRSILSVYAVGSELLEDAQADGTAKTAVVGIGFILPALNKVRELYNNHSELKSLQEKFIRQLPPEIIDNYEPHNTPNDAATADNIVASLKENGKVIITLKNLTTFELQTKSFWALRMFGGAAITTGVSVASAGLYIKQQIDANADGKITGTPDIDLQAASAGIWLSLIGAAAPLPNLYESYVSLRYAQVIALFEAISTSLRHYEKSFIVQDIPDWLLAMADVYMVAEFKGINFDIKERAKVEKERQAEQRGRQTEQLVEQLSAEIKDAKEATRLADERAKKAEEIAEKSKLEVEAARNAMEAATNEYVGLLKEYSGGDIESHGKQSKKVVELIQKTQAKGAKCTISQSMLHITDLICGLNG